MPNHLQLAFAGTPELAATILQRLIDSSACTITCVYTQPDRPAGRGRSFRKSAVKLLAESSHLGLAQPAGSSDFDADNELCDVDILVVAAYGMLLPAPVLTRPRLGCINVHTSLLPRWRGAAPIQRAIQAGDEKTGISIMQMDAGLDTGDILLQKVCPIGVSDTAGTLHDRLANLGADALLETLAGLASQTLMAQPQKQELASYAPKISKNEAEIDWNLPARTIERTVRAFNPSPVAHTCLNDIRMRIWEAGILDTGGSPGAPGTVVSASSEGIDVATADKVLRIKKLQLSGKKVISAAAFHNGHPHFCLDH